MPKLQDLISETAEVVIPGPSPDQRTMALDAVARLSKEYVSAGGFESVLTYAAYARTLPYAIDDATQRFGYDLYSRMRNDPQVESALQLLIQAVLTHGLQVAASVEKDQDGYKESQQYADFCNAVIDQLTTPLMDVLREMLLALVYGHKVAELIYEIKTLDPKDGPRMVLTSIKTKPLTSTAFVVDPFNNILGLVYMPPGGAKPLLQSLVQPVKQDADAPVLIPREKFFIFNNNPENGDPRGTSRLRPGYHAWWVKAQVWRSYLAFLATFAQPSIVVLTAPNAEPPELYDEQGNLLPQKSAEEVALSQALNLQNGSCAAFPAGSDVKVLEAHNTGQPFLDVIDLTNREITKTLLGQTLMTEEGAHMSRSAATTHQDVFGIIVRMIKVNLADALKRDVIMPLVRYNFGEDALRYAPNVALGQTEHQDFPAMAGAIAALVKAGFFDVSQYRELDNLMSLPARDPESWAKTMAQNEALVATTIAQAGSPNQVGGGAGPASPGKSPGGAATAASGGGGSAVGKDAGALAARTAAKSLAQKAADRVGFTETEDDDDLL